MVEVFALLLNEKIDNKIFYRLLNFVDKDKRDKILRYKVFEDAQRTLVADILARYTICDKLNVKNSTISFTRNKYGKTFLKDFQDLHYNISHSGKWVVCALCENAPVGIDVQLIKRVNLNIVKRFFSIEEYRNFLKKNRHQKLHYFFDLWTLKESYIKADGRGMSLPLDSFSIVINDSDRIRVIESGELIKCYFKQYYLESNYKLSVCSFSNKFSDKVTEVSLKNIIKNF